MPYRKPTLSPIVLVDPEKARRLIRKAFRDALCKRGEACKALDCSTSTLQGWIRQLGMEQELLDLEETAKKEGWHHGDVGGRPPGKVGRRLHVPE
jgi:hypothetical protein